MYKSHTRVLVFIALAVFTLPTYAYLDPASGSMMLQMILGGIAGIALVVKLFWHRVLGFFGVKNKSVDEDSAV